MVKRIDFRSDESKQLLEFFASDTGVFSGRVRKLACYMYKEKERALGKLHNGKVPARKILPFLRSMKGLKKEELEALFVVAGIVPPPKEDKKPEGAEDKIYKDEQGNVTAVVHQGTSASSGA